MRLLIAFTLCLSAAFAHAQDSSRSDWLRNPAMGNYKGCAEVKMGHDAGARPVWETLAEAGLGEPHDPAAVSALAATTTAAAN